MSDLRAAVVGTGFMGRVRAEALGRIGIPVAGVAGRRRSAPGAAELAPAYGDSTRCSPTTGVDAVHICSARITCTTSRRSRRCAAGKHVVCEKPLALTPAQAHELCATAADFGLVNAVCFINRFYPLCRGPRRRAWRSGSVGPVRLVTGHYLQDWLAKDTDWNWRLDTAVGGSLRVVGDIGSHWLDLVGYVIGQRVDAVMADLTTVIPQRLRPTGSVETFAQSDGTGESVTVTTEDMAGVLLRFSGGARGVLTSVAGVAGSQEQLEL